MNIRYKYAYKICETFEWYIWSKECLHVSTDAKSGEILEISLIFVTLDYGCFNCNYWLILV